MIILLENVANGTKLKIEKLDTNKWIDEKGDHVSNEGHIRILEGAQVGTEIGGLLYESRYKIVDVIA